MVRRDRTISLGLAAFAAALAIAQGLTGFSSEVMLLVPPLLMLAPLLAGRYVGEATIERLAARLAPRRRRPTPAHAGVRPATGVALRGGRLLAARLGRRGPPALLLAG